MKARIGMKNFRPRCSLLVSLLKEEKVLFLL